MNISISKIDKISWVRKKNRYESTKKVIQLIDYNFKNNYYKINNIFIHEVAF